MESTYATDAKNRMLVLFKVLTIEVDKNERAESQNYTINHIYVPGLLIPAAEVSPVHQKHTQEIIPKQELTFFNSLKLKILLHELS